MQAKPISFGIAGAGTAGLIAALMLRKAFPTSDITIVASSDVGIIGVGEGSTEHWSKFMHYCDIPLLEMIVETEATHKYGIRFEDWSNKFPDYFHSVSGDDSIFAWSLYPVYMNLISQEKLLTDYIGGSRLRDNKVRSLNMHKNTNQFHFDTFAINRYFTKKCILRGVKIIDSFVEDVVLNSENGNIESVVLKDAIPFSADFWIDATGFKRVLLSKVDSCEWNSFSDYLLSDSAFAFPTESESGNQIRPYTRARALSSGWAWEIPTQSRRGNGYVFSSQFISPEGAVDEMSNLLGFEVSPLRSFKFDPGHLKNPWVKNCCAIGLSGSFVEPLEATSIGSTIQQVEKLIPFVASYKPNNFAMQRKYNKSFNIMLDNILTMIRLHYMTDKTNSDFWVSANNMPVPDSLQEILDLLKETTLPRNMISSSDGEMFLAAHMLHVAQGQNLINIDSIDQAIQNLNLKEEIVYSIREIEHNSMGENYIDHFEALDAIEKE